MNEKYLVLELEGWKPYRNQTGEYLFNDSKKLCFCKWPNKGYHSESRPDTISRRIEVHRIPWTEISQELIENFFRKRNV